MRATRRRWLVTLAFLLVAAASGALGVTVWERRLELVVIPYHWRQVLALQALRARLPDDPAFRPTGPRGLSRFDLLLSKLTRLQRPEFLGGRGFGLIPVRAREGSLAHVAHCKPMEIPFDAPPDIQEGIVAFFCACEPHLLLAYDGRGHACGEPLDVLVWYGRPEPYRVLRDRARGHDLLRVAVDADCGRCCRVEWNARLELSVDRDGIAVHGKVTDDELAAPLCPPGPSREAEPPAPGAIAELLASDRPGDLHRALSLIARADREMADHAEQLLSHPDPLLRAQAAILLARLTDLSPAVFPLLRDPEARVRAAAVVAATAAPGWEPFVLPLVRDPHPLVARRAHLELLRAADREVRGRSLLHLLEARDPVVAYERFCDHDSPAFAAGLVGMLEGEKEDFFREALTFSLWSAFPREVLDRHIDRLLALFLVWDAEERWVYFLARSLVKLDDPRADEALIEAIRRRSGDEQATVPAIIDELLRRGTPIRAPRAREVLEELMRSGKACGEFDHSLSTCRELAAYLLLLAGSQEALHQLLSHFEESEDSPPIFESAPAAILVRLAGILAEEPEGCDARADLHLPGSQRDHNGRGEGEEVAAR